MLLAEDTDRMEDEMPSGGEQEVKSETYSPDEGSDVEDAMSPSAPTSKRQKMASSGEFCCAILRASLMLLP